MVQEMVSELYILSSEQRGDKLLSSGMLYIMTFSPTHGSDINMGHVTFKLSCLCLNSLTSV